LVCADRAFRLGAVEKLGGGVVVAAGRSPLAPSSYDTSADPEAGHQLARGARLWQMPRPMQHTETVPGRLGATQQTAARAILEALSRRGVDVAYGIPGGLISPIFDALSDVPRVRYIATRHEAMAGFAAMGHALATGRPALVLTTGGPGLTNAITAIASAFMEEVPMIVIAGDVPTSSTWRGALHDTSPGGLDGLAMLRTITRFSARIESADAAISTVEEAIRLAMGPRPGPVFLSLPLDVGNALSRATPSFPGPAAPPLLPDPTACARVAIALREAVRPLLVLGNGARGAAAEVAILAERLAIPVVVTPHAKGIFPDSHALHLGGIGFGGHPSATEYIESGPDVVLVVGSRLGDYATNGWSLPLCGTKATFHIDRESWVIGRNYRVTAGIVADAGAALRAIIEGLPADVALPVRATPSRRVSRPQSVSADSFPLAPARVMNALQEAFPTAVFAVDQGEHCAIALHYLTIDSPKSFRTMVGLASMGSGFGVGIGHRNADRSRPVVAIVGDGGFAMHAGEMLTLVEGGIDLIVVVMNDGCWNMVDKGFASVFGRRPDALPSHVADLAGVAREFGAIGVRIERPSDLDPARLRGLAAMGRPVLLDVRFDSSEALSVTTRSASLRRSTRAAS
jgi:acetolactate synthase I/II/III large subunit